MRCGARSSTSAARPNIVSISYGWPESLWTPAALEIIDELFAAAALFGISIFCAAGDSGADIDDAGHAHVRAPASSAFAHACGGTHALVADGGLSESAWSHGGGGFSARVPIESWQCVAADEAERLGIPPGRGVPDISAQVVPGYRVVRNGTVTFASGTSAVAPMWAALAARLNAALGANVGFFAPLLYAQAERGAVVREIVRGSNGHFHAHRGWNACSGLGTPVGSAILRAFGSVPLRTDDP